MKDEQVQQREVKTATADVPAHEVATAEEVRAEAPGVEQNDGPAADPVAGQVEAPRNPRSDAEGAHAELHPADTLAVESKPMIPCPHEELTVDHLGKVTCDGCGTELVVKKKELNPHHAAPPSAEPAPIVKAAPAEGTGDSRDTTKLDSLGNVKGVFQVDEDGKADRSKDPVEEHDVQHGSGPRGAGSPNESLADEEKRLRSRLADIRSQRGMSNTDQVDSIGNAQHAFKQEEQGHDKHGMRIPDKSTGEIVESAPTHIGPRGVGAPPETFHGKRPNGRS